jgi:hypothetical protein
MDSLFLLLSLPFLCLLMSSLLTSPSGSSSGGDVFSGQVGKIKRHGDGSDGR